MSILRATTTVAFLITAALSTSANAILWEPGKYSYNQARNFGNKSYIRGTGKAPGCTASLIGAKWVIGAKHCMGGSASSLWFKVDNKGARLLVAQKYTNSSGDVGLMRLKTNAPSGAFKAAPYASTDERGKVFTKAGFGGHGPINNISNGTPRDLLAGKNKIARVSSNGIRFFLDGDVKKEVNTWFGDSGGPAFVKKSGKWYVFGTTWRGRGTRDGEDGRVSQVRNWIKNVSGI